MRKTTLLGLVSGGIVALPGAIQAGAHDATPVTAGGTETFTLVERAELDIGDEGASPGAHTVTTNADRFLWTKMFAITLE